jgi:unsaturated pyranuronate lyase
MPFWNPMSVKLEEFRPGLMSKAQIGNNLVMACMEISPGLADDGHEHPYDQCGTVLSGRIEMFVGRERRVLNPHDAYFIPAGERHGWRTLDEPVKILDVSVKQG